MAERSMANMSDQWAKPLARSKLLLPMLMLLQLLLAGCCRGAVLILVMNAPVGPGAHQCL